MGQSCCQIEEVEGAILGLAQGNYTKLDDDPTEQNRTVYEFTESSASQLYYTLNYTSVGISNWNQSGWVIYETNDSLAIGGNPGSELCVEYAISSYWQYWGNATLGWINDTTISVTCASSTTTTVVTTTMTTSTTIAQSPLRKL